MKIIGFLLLFMFCGLIFLLGYIYVVAWMQPPPLAMWMITIVTSDSKIGYSGSDVLKTVSISQKGRNELILSGTVSDVATKADLLNKAGEIKSFYKQKDMIVTDRIVIVHENNP